MGLPLFVAPVESDVKSKPDSCSTSRRPNRVTRPTRARRRNRHLTTTSIGREPEPEQSRRGNPPVTRYPPRWIGRQDSVSPLDTSTGPGQSHRYGLPSEPREGARYFTPVPHPPPPRQYGHGRHSAHGGVSFDENDGGDTVRVPTPPYPRQVGERPSEPSTLLRPMGLTARERFRGLPSFLQDTYPVYHGFSSLTELQRAEARELQRFLRDNPLDAEPRRPRPVDGLGDRERSLSPEGDVAWDTLLSTLTPDPQPPSVGSSFASASASAAASQHAGESSNTSLSGPEMADDGLGDHACESGCEFCDHSSNEQTPGGRRQGRRDSTSESDDESELEERHLGLDQHSRTRPRGHHRGPEYSVDGTWDRYNRYVSRRRAERVLAEGVVPDSGGDDTTYHRLIEQSAHQRHAVERLLTSLGSRRRAYGLDFPPRSNNALEADATTGSARGNAIRTYLSPFPTTLDPEYLDPATVRPVPIHPGDHQYIHSPAREIGASRQPQSQVHRGEDGPTSATHQP